MQRTQSERPPYFSMLLELECTDGSLLAPIIEVIRVSMFKEEVESKLKDSKTFYSRQEDVVLFKIKAPFSLSTWTTLQLILRGFSATPFLSLALRYELIEDLTGEQKELMKVPLGLKRTPNLDVEGVLTGLLICELNRLHTSEPKQAWVRINTIISNFSFDLDFDAENSTLEHSICLPRSADVEAWPVVKITLPALPKGLRWKDDIVDRILIGANLSLGGDKMYYQVDGKTNQLLARAYDVWPEKSNAYAELSLTKKLIRCWKPWTIALPLCGPDVISMRDKRLPQKWHLNRVEIPYAEVSLSLTLQKASKELLEGPSVLVQRTPLKIDPIEVALDMDYIYVDQATRSTWINEDRTLSTPPTESSAPVEAKLNAPLQRAILDFTTTSDCFTSAQIQTEFEKSITITDSDKSDFSPAQPQEEATADHSTSTQTREESPSTASIPQPVRDSNHQPRLENMNQFHSATLDISSEGEIADLGIVAHGFVTGLLLQFVPSSKITTLFGDLSSVCPVTSLKLITKESVVLYECDACDLSELNWLKVGKKPPKPGALILPFSYSPFDVDNVQSALSFSKLPKIKLQLSFEPQFNPSEWKLSVATLGLNQICTQSGFRFRRYYF